MLRNRQARIVLSLFVPLVWSGWCALTPAHGQTQVILPVPAYAYNVSPAPDGQLGIIGSLLRQL